MTRSAKPSYSPKSVRKTEKVVTKQAVKDGVLDGETVAIRHSSHYRREVIHDNLNRAVDGWKEQEVYDESPKKAPHVRAPRRNGGRMDGSRWNGGSFVCAHQVDSDFDDESPLEDEEEELAPQSPLSYPSSTIEVSLLDLAKTTKRH
ncbi:hypothetical protein ONZ45_g11638 [Pleurotus djamor]|nr:hypothetical protein ONZ45_g11638 [Pleurotus djamor]